jgi:hypothetical protein
MFRRMPNLKYSAGHFFLAERLGRRINTIEFSKAKFWRPAGAEGAVVGEGPSWAAWANGVTRTASAAPMEKGRSEALCE